MEFFDDIYRKNSSPTSKYYAVCCRSARLSRYMMVLGYTSYGILYTLFFMVGAYDLWRTNGESQIIHIYIPRVHVTSPVGIAVLSILNTVTLVAAGFCVSPQDMFFILVFGNVPLVPAIVRTQMDELTALLKSKRPHSTGGATFVRRNFMHFIRVHHKYNEYVVEIVACGGDIERIWFINLQEYPTSGRQLLHSVYDRLCHYCDYGHSQRVGYVNGERLFGHCTLISN